MKFLQALGTGWARVARQPAGPIGLEVSAEALNLVQFDATADGPVMRAAASLAYGGTRAELLAAPKRLKALLREAFSLQPFRGRSVVSCLAADDLRIFPVGYTVSEGSDDATSIARELRERLKDELDASVVDFLPVRNADGDGARRDALVAVASRSAVLGHLGLLEQAGLQVRALDIGPAALARLVSFVNKADAREKYPNALVVNFGRRQSHLSVVWGRRLVLDRAIEFGECALLARVAKVLSMSEDMAQQMLQQKGFDAAADARDGLAGTLFDVLRADFAVFAAEVNETLQYTASRSRGRGIDQVYLLGSIGRYPGIGALLREMLSVPVEVLNPFAAFRCRPAKADLDRIQPIAGIALASGLALRGMQAYA
jgi:type IV pilus assembly protein PilM